MKKINIDKMATITGGGWGDFADGVCAAVAGVSIGAVLFKSVVKLTPGVGQALLVADVACLAYEIYKHT